MMAEAAKSSEPLPAMRANVAAAQADYDKASNRVSELKAKVEKALADRDYETVLQLRMEVKMADSERESCGYKLDHHRDVRSKVRKSRLRFSKMERRKQRPTSTHAQPSEMRSSAI